MTEDINKKKEINKKKKNEKIYIDYIKIYLN